MAPALTVIPDHTLQHLDHLIQDYADLGPDLDRLTAHLGERSGAGMRGPQATEVGAIHGDLACDTKIMLGEIVIDLKDPMKI